MTRRGPRVSSKGGSARCTTRGSTSGAAACTNPYLAALQEAGKSEGAEAEASGSGSSAGAGAGAGAAGAASGGKRGSASSLSTASLLLKSAALQRVRGVRDAWLEGVLGHSASHVSCFPFPLSTLTVAQRCTSLLALLRADVSQSLVRSVEALRTLSRSCRLVKALGGCSSRHDGVSEEVEWLQRVKAHASGSNSSDSSGRAGAGASGSGSSSAAPRKLIHPPPPLPATVSPAHLCADLAGVLGLSPSQIHRLELVFAGHCSDSGGVDVDPALPALPHFYAALTGRGLAPWMRSCHPASACVKWPLPCTARCTFPRPLPWGRQVVVVVR